MSLWTIPALLGLGLLLLYWGAEWLVRGSASLALRLGLSPLVVGLTVVAYGTSTPEMAVSLKAALQDRGSVALGSAVGSNICNLGLILGVAVLVRPLRVQMQLLRFDLPVMIGGSLLIPVLLWDGLVSRSEGLLLLVLIVAYTVANVRFAQREKNPAVLNEFAASSPAVRRRLGLDLLLIATGIALLVLGGRFFLDGAVGLARRVNVSEAVIALTVVAAGTSLPELAAAAMAALKREPDIAIGNIVGSCIFNLLNIVGLSALVRPLDAEGVGAVDLGAMIGLALLAAPLMRTGLTLRRWEGGMFLLVYGGYMVYRLAG